MAADGSVILDVDMNVSDANKKLAKLKNNIEKAEKEIEEATQKREAAQQESLFKSAELDAEKAKLQEIKDRLEEIRALSKDKSVNFEQREDYKAMIPDIRRELDEQQTRVNALQAEWNKIDNSIGKYDKKITEANQSLERQIDEAGELQRQIDAAEAAQSGMAGAVARAGDYMDRFTARIKKLASRVFVFTLITMALRSLRTWLGKAVKSNDEAAKAISNLNGALLTLAQPIVGIIIPAFVKLVNVLAQVVSFIASIVSTIFGSTASESAKAAKGLYDEMNALEGVSGAADDAAKSLAGFDEINKLDDSSGGGGAGAGVAEFEPNFDSSFIQDGLNEIAALVGAALLAVGAILTFSGVNIPLGIALMAAGALTLGAAVAMNWGAISALLQGALGGLVAVLSAAVLVIGAVLAFSGINIPLGLGLMAMGALGLAAVVTANWGAMTAEMQQAITAIMGVLGVALLALGATLAFSGANIPLGIGLMAVGAVGLAASVKLNWSKITKLVEGSAGAVAGAISVALLALGAILAFSGANIPLGIGLIAVGAVGLAASIAANWETIQKLLQGPVGIVTTMVSAALLVLGAILTFSGAALPLGIGLLAVGAIGLATSIAANWETIQTAVGGPIGAVTAIVSAALLVLGVILLFTGAGVPLGLGLIAVGAAGLAVAIAPNWDFIKEAISGAYENMIAWWNANAAKFFSYDYWAGLALDMLNGLFGGLYNLGSRIAEWGGSFISGVKDFFGIHSPSTEFESLGDYMMAGLENGLTDNTPALTAAFSAMFLEVFKMSSETGSDMTAIFAAFLLYLTSEFTPSWEQSWKYFYTIANQNIRAVMLQIDALKAKLASIERNITIRITTIQETISGSSSGGSSLRSASTASSFSARLAAMPNISQMNIPALATGAVIPPNREFLAVLGDQKSGNNIEAPEDLIRQIVREETGGGNQTVALLSAILAAIKAGATMEVDKREFGKIVRDAYNTESARVGVSFAGVRV